MELNKEIKKIHEGYQLQGVSESWLAEKDIKSWCKRLERIPYKISCFIKRTDIKRAYKENEFVYYIIDTNDKIFVLDY